MIRSRRPLTDLLRVEIEASLIQTTHEDKVPGVHRGWTVVSPLGTILHISGSLRERAWRRMWAASGSRRLLATLVGPSTATLTPLRHGPSALPARSPTKSSCWLDFPSKRSLR